MWLTDCGRHQVIRLDANGVEDWAFGIEGEPGHDAQHLCMPTNVDTDGQGHVYISDGYCNARVLKVDIALREVVATYTVPKKYEPRLVDNPDMLNADSTVVHSLALSLCDNLLLAADREHG